MRLPVIVILLLLIQNVVNIVGLPDCICTATFNTVDECVAAYWRMYSHIDVSFRLSWHSLDSKTI